MSNRALLEAKIRKRDEFYTPISTIEKELREYKRQFKNKVVYCNCDDPSHSNFWKYFHLNFKNLGLKRLISTYYSYDKPSYKKEYNGGNDNDINVGIETPLQNGDFRSSECIGLLKRVDIVVTNPPFSLFREYFAQLVEYEKKFLILANLNAITYKQVFPFFRENKVRLGITIHSGDTKFYVPDDYELTASGCGIEEGKKYIKVNSVRWFTNLTIIQKEKINFNQTYSPNKYPKYDNYDAINIDRISDMPIDYYGVMGVPITYMDKHCPEQFEIVGISKHNNENMDGGYWLGGNSNATINGREIYKRILIQRKMKGQLDLPLFYT